MDWRFIATWTIIIQFCLLFWTGVYFLVKAAI